MHSSVHLRSYPSIRPAAEPTPIASYQLPHSALSIIDSQPVMNSGGAEARSALHAAASPL